MGTGKILSVRNSVVDPWLSRSFGTSPWDSCCCLGSTDIGSSQRTWIHLSRYACCENVGSGRGKSWASHQIPQLYQERLGMWNVPYIFEIPKTCEIYFLCFQPSNMLCYCRWWKCQLWDWTSISKTICCCIPGHRKKGISSSTTSPFPRLRLRPSPRSWKRW